MARRAFLTRMAQLAALPFLTVAGSLQAQAGHKQLKILMKSAWGSDDPTKAAFPFSHGLALAEAGHEVQIYLLGEAVVLMRKVVAEAGCNGSSAPASATSAMRPRLIMLTSRASG